MEDNILLADYVAAVTAFAAALEDVTDLGLVRADININVPALTFAAVADSNVDVGATASGWLDTATPKKASAKIPGIKMSLIASDGSMPITGVVATYLALFETDAGFNLSDGEQIDSWVKGSLDK